MRRVLVVLVSLLFILALAVPVAWAKEPATPELSLERAIELALAQSKSVRKAEREVERTEEMRSYRADQLDYTPLAPPGTAAVEVPWSNFLMADLTWRMSKKSLTAEEDRVVLDACEKYWDVLTAQDKVRAAEAALESARRQLQNARASYNAGLLSVTALIGAEAGYRGAEASLARARHDLDNAYEALNQLIGLWPQDRPVLTDTVAFTPLEINDLDYEVTKVLETAPSVWLAQEKVTLQKYLEDLMFYTGEYRPYQARKIEVEEAELDAISARDALRLATRELYYTVRSLEEAYAAAAEGVRTAEEALRVTRLKQEAGMATAAEVAEKEASLAEAHQGLFELACQHAYMKLAFQKPWALQSRAAGA